MSLPETNYEDYTALDAIHDIMETERVFHQTVRFLDSRTRNHIVAAQLRNTALALDIIRRVLAQPARPTTTTMVMNFPLTMDVSGNFFDPVPVVPTRDQITIATEMHVGVAEGSTCAICQDAVSCATRLRHCGHFFHGSCIDQWLQMNPRCPVCRHDIREQRLLRQTGSTTNESSSLHTNQE